ncbi:MAG: hypothetical protein A2161_01915, partial [Candidatus Schekmanbacteria bacterium RBG_13_48_7]
MINLQNRQSVSLFLFVLAVVVFGLLASGKLFPLFPLTGDEPAYLLITDSLIFDGDLMLYNNYRSNQHILRFTKPGYELFTHIGKNKKHYPHHGIGFPLILFPFYFWSWELSDYWFHFVLRLPILLMTALFLALTYRMLSQYFKGDTSPFWFSLILIFSSPFLFYSRLFYPEIPIALSTLIIVNILLNRSVLTFLNLFLCGCCLGIFPWFGIKYLALETGLTISLIIHLIFSKEFRINRLIILLMPVLFLLSMYFVFQYSLYGNLNFIDKYTTRLPAGELQFYQEHPTIKSVIDVWPYLLKRAIPRFVGYFLDQRHGILLFAPIFLVFFPGLIYEIKLNWKLSAVLLLPFVFHIGLYSLFGSWGGYTPPTRPLLAVFSIIIIFCVRGFSETIRKNNRELLILLFGITLWMTFIHLRNPEWLYHNSKIAASPERNQILTAYSSSNLNLTQFFPSFFGPWQFWNWISNLIWIAVIFLICRKLVIRKTSTLNPTFADTGFSVQYFRVISAFIIILLLMPLLFTINKTALSSTDFSALLKNRVFSNGITGAYYFNDRWRDIPRFIIRENAPEFDRPHWSIINNPEAGVSIKWNGFIQIFLPGLYRINRFPFSLVSDIRIDNYSLPFPSDKPSQIELQFDQGFHAIQVQCHSNGRQAFRSAIFWEYPDSHQFCSPPMYFTDLNNQISVEDMDAFRLKNGMYFESIGAWKQALYMYKQITSSPTSSLRTNRLRQIFDSLTNGEDIDTSFIGLLQQRVFNADRLKTSYSMKVEDEDTSKSIAIKHLAKKQ